MKVIVLLLAIIAISQCYWYNGTYNTYGQCNIYSCPATYTQYGNYQFTCPQNGYNTVAINYNSYYRQYTMDMRTVGQGYSGGYAQVNFTQNDIKRSGRDEQAQVPLGNGYIMNLMPCLNGNKTSSLCPNDYTANRTIIGWKSYNATKTQYYNCTFVLQRTN